QRVRVDDEGAARVVDDVEELERLRRRAALHDRGVLVVEGAVARAVELILARVPRHAATEVRALAIGRDDPARRVDDEELTLEVEDRRVVRRLEAVEDALLGPHRDLRSEAGDPVYPDERHDRDGGCGESG